MESHRRAGAGSSASPPIATRMSSPIQRATESRGSRSARAWLLPPHRRRTIREIIAERSTCRAETRFDVARARVYRARGHVAQSGRRTNAVGAVAFASPACAATVRAAPRRVTRRSSVLRFHFVSEGAACPRLHHKQSRARPAAGDVAAVEVRRASEGLRAATTVTPAVRTQDAHARAGRTSRSGSPAASASRSWARTARASRRSSGCSRRCCSTTAAPRACSATTRSRDARAVRRLVNRVSVEASFFKKMTAEENLSYAARFYGLTPARPSARSQRSSTASASPPERRSEPMENLSRGMQQKVALARALLTSPVLLLLDEPTTGLDPRSKLEVQEFIREIRAEHDATILLCTHDLAEAEALADRVGILDRGELLCLEPVDGAGERVRSRDARGGVLRRDRSRVRAGRRGGSGPGGVRMSAVGSPAMRHELIGLGGVVERNWYLDQALRLVGGRVVRLDGREHAHDRLHREGHRGGRRQDRRRTS